LTDATPPDGTWVTVFTADKLRPRVGAVNHKFTITVKGIGKVGQEADWALEVHGDGTYYNREEEK
jgi:hypothetical protein